MKGEPADPVFELRSAGVQIQALQGSDSNGLELGIDAQRQPNLQQTDRLKPTQIEIAAENPDPCGHNNKTILSSLLSAGSSANKPPTSQDNPMVSISEVSLSYSLSPQPK